MPSSVLKLLPLLAIMAMTPCWANLSADKIQASVNASKILGKDRQATVALSGNEVFINTFKHSGAAVDTDLKIDAVLLAKHVMAAADDSVTRVTTRFYLPSSKSYSEVSVTVGDIKAFASGAIQKQELLNALKIVNVQEATKPAAAFKPPVPSKDGWVHYNNYGISFDVPKSWTSSAPYVPRAKVVFCDLDTEMIMFDATFENEPVATKVAEVLNNHKHSGEYPGYRPLEAEPIIKFGPQKNISAFQECFTFEFALLGKTYERSLFFGWPGRIYNLRLWCTEDRYKETNAVFERVLNTVRFTPGYKPAR